MKHRTMKSILLAALLIAVLATSLNALAAVPDDESPSELAARVQEMAQRLEALEEARALDIALNRSELKP